MRRGRLAIAVGTVAAIAGCGAAGSSERPAMTAPKASSPPVHRRVLGDVARAGRAARRVRAAARRAAGYLTAIGRGSAFLPLVHVKPGSTMAWTNAGRFFQVFDQHDVVAVTSIAHAEVLTFS